MNWKRALEFIENVEDMHEQAQEPKCETERLVRIELVHALSTAHEILHALAKDAQK